MVESNPESPSNNGPEREQAAPMSKTEASRIQETKASKGLEDKMAILSTALDDFQQQYPSLNVDGFLEQYEKAYEANPRPMSVIIERMADYYKLEDTPDSFLRDGELFFQLIANEM